MKRFNKLAISSPISKEAFDEMFEQLNETLGDNVQSKVRRVQLRQWRKLKQQLI